MEYLIFSIAGYRFALDLQKICEIVIPGTGNNDGPEKILQSNKLSFQDKIIPAVILANYTLNIADYAPANFRLVVCESGGGKYGLIVDSVDEIIVALQEKITSPDNVPSDLKADFLEGIIVEEETESYILALDKIFLTIKSA